MFYPLRLYLKDRWIMLPLISTVLLVAFTIWYTVSRIHPTDQPLSLHYNIIFGIDLIGEWWKLWFIPVMGLVIGVINFGISHFIYDKKKALSRFLAIVTVLLEALLIMGNILLVSLNS